MVLRYSKEFKVVRDFEEKVKKATSSDEVQDLYTEVSRAISSLDDGVWVDYIDSLERTLKEEGSL